MPGNEWPDETIARLRELWPQGLSAAKIGRRLGISKNAVVGKAHRLNLPARASPILRNEPGSVRQRAKPPRPPKIRDSLPPLPSALTAAPPPPLPPPALRRAASAPVCAAPTPPPAPAAKPYGRVAECCWPIGEPGTRSFRFCDDASEPGKPYCAEHSKLAYVRVHKRENTELAFLPAA